MQQATAFKTATPPGGRGWGVQDLARLDKDCVPAASLLPHIFRVLRVPETIRLRRVEERFAEEREKFTLNWLC